MNSNRVIKVTALLLAALLLLVLLLRPGRSAPDPSLPPPLTVVRGGFQLWSPFEALIQAEHQAAVYSRISQPTAILYLAPEGTRVAESDLVAELDRSPLDQTLATLERDHALAQADLDTLTRADIPQEIATLETEWNSLRYEIRRQQRIVDNTRELMDKGLVSESEFEAQTLLLANLEQQRAHTDARRQRLTDTVHPARLAQARARLEAARRQLELLYTQADSARMTAPFDGIVVHLPLHIDGEFRNAREGDTLYRNQKLLQVAGTDAFLAHFLVPEAALARVPTGRIARIIPTAFPGLVLTGIVESAGTVAVSVSGRPAWQKFFQANARIQTTDPRLRSNMSATLKVLSHQEDHVLLVPRGYIGWEGTEPWCRVQEGKRITRRSVEPGPGNDTHWIIRHGLAEGDILHWPAP